VSAHAKYRDGYTDALLGIAYALVRKAELANRRRIAANTRAPRPPWEVNAGEVWVEKRKDRVRAVRIQAVTDNLVFLNPADRKGQRSTHEKARFLKAYRRREASDEFLERLREMMEEDREILERLAGVTPDVTSVADHSDDPKNVGSKPEVG